MLDATSAKALISNTRIRPIPSRYFEVPSPYVHASKADEMNTQLYISDGINFTSEEMSDDGMNIA